MSGKTTQKARVVAYLTEEEKQALEREAERRGMSVSTFLRYLLRLGMRPQDEIEQAMKLEGSNSSAFRNAARVAVCLAA